MSVTPDECAEENPDGDLSMDRTQFSVARLTDPDD